jgi:hypothetical protein
MSDTSEFLKRAAVRSGFQRQHYVEKNIPTDPSNIVAVPFFGDYKSCFVLSSLILKNYKEANPEKYIILCSWPGIHAFFPFVDEVWTLEDESAIKNLAVKANNFYNDSNLATELTRSLVEVLNIFTSKDILKYYDKGFTKKYLEDFGEVKRFLPEIPSANLISSDFKNQLNHRVGQKIMVYPATRMKSWQQGVSTYLPIQKEFWIALINRIIDDGFVPVVYQNWFTYDMSKDFVDRCLYLVPRNMSDLLAALRQIGFVLDIHTGISRLAIEARCPYLAVTERKIYIEDKDYEIDDLCAEGLPRQYIFSFSTQLMVGGPDEWEVSVLGNISARLKEFVPQIDPELLPSTTSSYQTVSYDSIRHRKSKRLGLAFIRTSRNK